MNQFGLLLLIFVWSRVGKFLPIPATLFTMACLWVVRDLTII